VRQGGRLDEAALGLTRGVAGLVERAGHGRADLAGGFEVLLAHLIEAP